MLATGRFDEYGGCVDSGEREEMTAAAIARLAGVGRAAVSNWRRRYPEFPQPVGGSATSPTFDRAEIEAWLKATGKAHQLATAGQTDTGTQRISEPERSITDLQPGELLAMCMAALLPRETAAVGRAGRAEDEDEPGGSSWTTPERPARGARPGMRSERRRCWPWRTGSAVG